MEIISSSAVAFHKGSVEVELSSETSQLLFDAFQGNTPVEINTDNFKGYIFVLSISHTERNSAIFEICSVNPGLYSDQNTILPNNSKVAGR